MSVKIKICGVSDPALLPKMAGLGIDAVGLMLDPKSRRLLDETLADQLAKACREAGIDLVLLPGDRELKDMERLIDRYRPDAVQLLSKSHDCAKHFSPDIQRYYAFSPNEGSFAHIDLSALDFKQERDVVVYESSKPGHGVAFDYEHFQPVDANYFIAGGLSPQNVAAIIERFSPYGVDVSSGVESSLGVKDLKLIEQFVGEARG